MKSQVQLLESLLADAGSALGFSPERDFVTLRKRTAHEGESFMTAAMPRLDDALLEGLRDGKLPSIEGWSTHRSLPRYLNDIWKLIFSEEDGTLLPDPSVIAIKWLRQILRLQKKIFEVCSDEKVDAAIQRFREVDNDLPSRKKLRTSIDPYARQVSQVLFGQIIGESLCSIPDGKHGPGAVSEQFGSNERWSFNSISHSIESLVGPEFFRSSWADLLDRPPLNAMVPARLVAVPKTAEKPRLISIEPSYNQFVQQPLQLSLKERLFAARSICSYTLQDPNRKLAQAGSIDGLTATIDLSDASDRVSLALVEEVFGFNPSFLRYLRLSRSAFVQLPGGELILLNKFASMGSALTFPVEAMVFTTIVITAICRAEGNFSPNFIKKLGKRGQGLSVYGDDIIVPTHYYPHVVAALESVGLKVNRGKSFDKGFFRESCGMDAYSGVDVTPAYMRRRAPATTSDSAEIASWGSLRNQLYTRFGYISAVRFIDDLISKIVVMPEAPDGTPGIVRWSSTPDLKWSRWNRFLHRLEWKVIDLKPQKRKDPIGGYVALNKSLRTGFQEDPEHLLYAGRPVATKVIYRWESGY